MLELKEAIRRIAANNEEIYSVIAKVTAIDEDARTIDVKPIDGGAELFDVKLQANINGITGLVLIPALDSEVVITFLSKETAFLSLCTDIDKILIDTPEITINGGSNGGLVKVQELADKLSAVETLTNNLLTTLQKVIVPLAPSGSYLLGTLFASFAPIAPTTSKADLENDKVKH